MGSIHFFVEDVQFKLSGPRKISHWIKQSITSEGKKLGGLNFVFCSDDYLLRMNQEYLNHKTLTDIITFDNSEEEGTIGGDIFISVDRVRENSVSFQSGFDRELHRVMIHGVLHLVGYSDKNTRDKAVMRGKEDAYLSLQRK